MRAPVEGLVQVAGNAVLDVLCEAPDSEGRRRKSGQTTFRLSGIPSMGSSGDAGRPRPMCWVGWDSRLC